MLDIQAELHDQGQAYGELYEAVGELKRRHDLHPCSVRPRDGLALRRDSERETVQDLVKRFRDLPREQQRRLPALLNSLAQLEVVVGEIEASQSDFSEVARLVTDPISQAEAHHNVYRAALERCDWLEALASIRRAVALDAPTFEPFPFERFEPRKILGAGGFGVTFLCRETATGQDVTVRSLRVDSLDRPIHEVFHDFAMLQDLDYPVFIRLRGFGLAHEDAQRPFVIAEYFEGMSLAEHVAAHGPLTPEDWLPIAWAIARAAQAAHSRFVLHRGLRPGSVLVRREGGDDQAVQWHVKIIDAGLGLERAVIHANASHSAARMQTALGRSVARWLPFAPPEQVAKPKGQAWIRPCSDVFAFGRLGLFALTGKVDPDANALQKLPDDWRLLLMACAAWVGNQRLQHFGVVGQGIVKIISEERAKQLDAAMHDRAIAELSRQIDANPQTVAPWVMRGTTQARFGNFNAAIADFSRALELQPGDAGLLRRRALANLRAGHLDESKADYTEALRVEPRNLESFANRGLAHAQRGELDLAVADYSEAIRLSPNDSALWYNRGNAYLGKEDFDHAIADYTEAIRRDSANVWAHGNRGKAYLGRGDLSRALTDLNRALNSDPENTRTLVDRATVYLRQNQLDKAIADYTRAIELDPTAELYHFRGVAHGRQNKLELARDDFSEAINLDSSQAISWIFRGNTRAELGDTAGGLEDFDEGLRLVPDHGLGLQSRGKLLQQLGRDEAALADFRAAVTVDPELTDSWFEIGNAHAEAGEHEAAAADFARVLEFQPNNSAALANRGNALAWQGQLDEALELYNAALALDPDDTHARANRANVLGQKGQAEKALADYQEVLRIDPSLTKAWLAAGTLHFFLRQFEAARDAYARAIESQPDLVDGYFARGNALVELNALDDAMLDYSKTLAMDPTHIGALNNRANLLMKRGEYKAADADFLAAIAADTTLPMTHTNRGNLLVTIGDFAGAVAEYTEALRLAPQEKQARRNRAKAYSRLNQIEKAVADHLEVIRIDPDNAASLNDLAWLWATTPRADLRKPERAVECALRAAELVQPLDANTLDTLAAAYAAAGKFADAVATQKRAIELALPIEQEGLEVRLHLYEKRKMYLHQR